MAMTITGKGFEVDSDFLHVKKCARRCAGMDRISELPDEIISHILSFLPFKDAVATSVLSPRWSNSWKYIPNLVFVDHSRWDALDLDRSIKNVEWVNSVLHSYKGLSLKQLTISFYLHRDAFHHLTKWLQFAFSRRVECLKLDFEGASFVLDLNVLSGIKSSDCKFLKELTLQNLAVSGEAIEFLLLRCPVLEGLIINATLTSDLLIIGGALKYFEINSFENHGKSIKVSAPNLRRLHRFDHDVKKLLLEHVPNLVEASFVLDRDDSMLHFAKAAAKLEALTISLSEITAFAVPQMPNLKKLVVDYASVRKRSLLPITRLLEASPCLEQFKLEVTDLNKYYYGVSSIHKAIFKVPEDGGFPHKHLKVLEFVGFCDKAADHVELVRYIGNNCVGLEEIVITPISIPVARELELRDSSEYMKREILARQVDVIAEKKEVLKMKKSTEKVLAGKLPDRIKLLVN